MTEPVVSSKIVKMLNCVQKCYAKKRFSGKFQSGEPDISGCYMGKLFLIEVKMIGGELTLLQSHQLEKWRESGARTHVAIYDPSDKNLKITSIHSSESWGNFAGRGKIKEAYRDSATPGQRLGKFDFHDWLCNSAAEGGNS